SRPSARWSPVERTRFKVVPPNSTCRLMAVSVPDVPVRNLWRACKLAKRSSRSIALRIAHTMRAPETPRLGIGRGSRFGELRLVTLLIESPAFGGQGSLWLFSVASLFWGVHSPEALTRRGN